MQTVDNPYRTSDAVPLLGDDDSPSAPRLKFVIWLSAYLFPVWLVCSFYSVWLVAWIQLGHRPRPMLDDPKDIGGFMDFAYFVPGFLLLAMPALIPLGLAASFFCPLRVCRGRRFILSTTLVVLYVALCTFALVGLRKDPGGVVEWWLD